MRARARLARASKRKQPAACSSSRFLVEASSRFQGVPRQVIDYLHVQPVQTGGDPVHDVQVQAGPEDTAPAGCIESLMG